MTLGTALEHAAENGERERGRERVSLHIPELCLGRFSLPAQVPSRAAHTALFGAVTISHESLFLAAEAIGFHRLAGTVAGIASGAANLSHL